MKLNFNFDFDRKKLKNRLIRVTFAIAIAFILHQFNLVFLETFSYDFRFKLKPTSPVSGHIETVAIDKETVGQMQRSPNARDHIRLLEILSEQNPKAIVYLIHPNELVGSYDELQKFAKTAKQLGNFIVLSDKLSLKGELGRLEMPPPFTGIKVAIGPKTSDRDFFGKDGVTRRMIVSYQDRMTLHPVLAQLFNNIEDESEYQGIFKNRDTKEAYIDFHPKGTYKANSFSNVLKGELDPNLFSNKVVIVGRDTEGTPRDYIQTPYSREPLAMSLLEMHANMLDTMILNRAPIQVPSWINFLITAIVATLIIYVVLTVSPTQGLAIIVGTLGLFCILAYVLFSFFTIWINMAYPFLSIFICYYFFIPYRLIVENKRSWEYYQKHKLLSQVEELKSNFLSMMSHDIKTPLARIQGMADIVKREGSNLSETQSNAINTIGQSTHDLTEFISTLLDLGRIESKDIKLHLRSKDLNALLTEVISKHEFLAQQKDIKILTEFEPLFSIKVDVELMKQVFSNLIENAIKYSPRGSKILVSTEETDGRVYIQVADQGAGIAAEDMPNVFMKFYRSKAAMSSSTKGTGIGLYLAKYFVDLHKGQIEVESALNKGSTFSVNLPMEQ